MPIPLPADPQECPTSYIAAWFMEANLREISELQMLLAKEGIELHIGTGQLVVEQDNPFDK